MAKHFSQNDLPHRSRPATWLPAWRRTFRGHWRLSGLALACLLLGMGALYSQQSMVKSDVARSGAEPDHTLAVHVDEVDLAFVVTDKRHHWVTDLSANEVSLRDNGLAPEAIRTFQSESGLPLRIGLLLDTSGSIQYELNAEKDAAEQFVSKIVDPAKDQAFVLGFTDKPSVLQELTSDRQALASAVENLTVGGATAIYDAVELSCQKLAQHKDDRLTGRVLILVTDGMDNSSYMQPEQVIETAVRSNVVVMVLDTQPNANPKDPEYKILQKLAEETGGQVLLAANKKQVTKAFNQLSSQLRSFYLLAYRPAQFARDGSYRKIQLKITRHGVHILCRRGYYAANDKD
jgi:VWFA-related protein